MVVSGSIFCPLIVFSIADLMVFLIVLEDSVVLVDLPDRSRWPARHTLELPEMLLIDHRDTTILE